MKKILILLLGLSLLFPTVVNADNTPLIFVRDSVDHQQPVEQQSPNFFFQ